MRPETEQKAKRWQEQRWILDNMVRSFGIDWDQTRSARIMRACGPMVGPDLQFLSRTIKKFDDIPTQLAAVASKWEALAGEEERREHRETACQYYYIATVFYSHAQWAFFEDDNEDKIRYNQRKNACYDKMVAHAPRRIERVEIPFEGKSLAGALHLPRGFDPPYPVVLSISGMDAGEREICLYDEPLLERGVAMFRIEGPGQCESNLRKIRATADNWERAGRNAIDYLVSRKDIRGDSIALHGNSMGSYWGFRVASADHRLGACVLSSNCFEPGMTSLLNAASPTFKLNLMYMTGYTNEREFDEFARGLTLKGLGSKIRCPMFILAGERDELSPLACTFELFEEVKTPKKLRIYKGDTHSIADPMKFNVIADWIVDRLKGKAIGPGEKQIEYV
ncbi:MAG: alpha/beta hydrolase [Chloroflexi bacterium]|nr:alpha/beta hydrolase [Chloroflexota bacterium]